MFRSRPHSLVALMALCLLGACVSPHEIEVRLVHSRSLVPEDAFDRLELRIVEAEGGRVVHRGSTVDSLAEPVELFDADALQTGRRYVLELRAEAPGACRLGRATGRSLPFEHRDGAYSVAVQVGCADELHRTRARPSLGRLTHGAVTASDSEVVLVGGVSSALNDPPAGEPPFGAADMVAELERYDPRSGRFVLGGALSTPRAWSALVPLEDGAVGVLGGYVPEGAVVPCTADVEVISGLSTSTREPLERIRCLPTAVRLDAGPVVVLGGTDGALGEAFDAELRARLRADLPQGTARVFPTVVPLADGESALVVGGVGAGGEPMAGILRVVGERAAEASFVPLTMEDEPAGLALPAAAYAPCESGGGAVYLLGGQNEAESALDRAWCYRDVPGAEPGGLVRAGALPEPRRGASGALVPGPGGDRVLLVGGEDGVTGTLPYDGALLVPVDGCACAPVGEAQRIPVPMDGLLLFHTTTGLHDGSALVVGGARLPPGGERWVGTGEAALVVPDLP